MSETGVEVMAMLLRSKPVERFGVIAIGLHEIGLGSLGGKLGHCIYSRTATARIRSCTDDERNEQDQKL